MAKAQRLQLHTSGIFLLAAIVGALGGLGGWGFRRALEFLQGLAMGPVAGKDIGATVEKGMIEAARDMSTLWTVLVPAIGGLLAGLLLLIVAKRPSPFGIASYMEMVQTRRSKIQPFRSLVQILSSTCSLASGGSLGREGAITHVSTTFASMFSGFLKEGSRNRVVLVACGIAAGMASSYNAPIAGAIFVMEVILGSFAMEIFAPLVVSSVISTIVTKSLVGTESEPVYMADPETGKLLFDNTPLIFSAILLGVFCGAGGVLFSMALERGRQLFRMVPGPIPVRLALGGLLVGGIGVWYPEVWGNGYEAINMMTQKLVKDDALNPMPMLLAILVLKLVATAFTTGSGALGGVFTPTLVVGASFGAFFAYGLAFFTDVGEDAKWAFTLVGMAGICAATCHAPITAIMLIFELTLDYNIILPVMLCSIIASLTARFLAPDSYYTARLRERGHAQAAGVEELAMQTNYVRDIMRADPVRVHQSDSFEQVMDLFGSTRRDTVYVVDPMFTLIGRIHLHDVKYFINDPSLGSVVIAADLTRKAVTVTPDETLASILHRFDDPDLDELAVVSEGETPTLEGRVTRRDVMACLSDEVLGQRKLRTRFRSGEGREDSHVQLPSATDLSKVRMPDHLVGRTIGSLELPEGILPLILVENTEDGREQRTLAEPQVVISDDSELIVIGTLDSLQRFNMMLKDRLPDVSENG